MGTRGTTPSSGLRPVVILTAGSQYGAASCGYARYVRTCITRCIRNAMTTKCRILDKILTCYDYAPCQDYNFAFFNDSLIKFVKTDNFESNRYRGYAAVNPNLQQRFDALNCIKKILHVHLIARQVYFNQLNICRISCNVYGRNCCVLCSNHEAAFQGFLFTTGEMLDKFLLLESYRSTKDHPRPHCGGAVSVLNTNQLNINGIHERLANPLSMYNTCLSKRVVAPVSRIRTLQHIS